MVSGMGDGPKSEEQGRDPEQTSSFYAGYKLALLSECCSSRVHSNVQELRLQNQSCALALPWAPLSVLIQPLLTAGPHLSVIQC